MNPRDIIQAITDKGLEIHLTSEGRVKIENLNTLPEDLRSLARSQREGISSHLRQASDSIWAELDAILDRWERGCRWWAERPGLDDGRAYKLIGDVGSDVIRLLGDLERISPADARLKDARERFDKW